MYPLPSLAAALVAREAITLATAQFLADWQIRAERQATPEGLALLAQLVELLPILPRPPLLISVAVDREIEGLIAAIRRCEIFNLQAPLACKRLAHHLQRLVVLVPASA